MGSKMVVHVGPLECTPKGEDQRYSLKRHVLDLESKIGENNITISNVDEECKQELAEQKTTIQEQITTLDEKQQNSLDEQKTKIDQLSTNSEQHQGELQRLSLENVAEVKKLAEQKSILDEHKSELDRHKSENELQHEAIKNSVQDINSTISHIGNENSGKIEKLVVKDNQHDEKIQNLIESTSRQSQSFLEKLQKRDCPNAGNYKTINGVCYLFHSEEKNYNDAKLFCESKIAMAKTGRLVEPKTTTTNKLIYDNAKTIFGDSFKYFIGVNDISSEGTWVYSSTRLSATTMFFSSQPNEGTNANCVYLGTGCGGTAEKAASEEKWCDGPCDTAREIICEF